MFTQLVSDFEKKLSIQYDEKKHQSSASPNKEIEELITSLNTGDGLPPSFNLISASTLQGQTLKENQEREEEVFPTSYPSMDMMDDFVKAHRDFIRAEAKEAGFLSTDGANNKKIKRVKALFIGINYIGTKNELKGCINDIRTMQFLLQLSGFFEACNVPGGDKIDDQIRILAEVSTPKTSGTNSLKIEGHDDLFLTPLSTVYGLPTKENIRHSLQWLVEAPENFDGRKEELVLFLHFSGHGTHVEDKNGDELDGEDEAMVPLDFQTYGFLTDDEIYKIVVESSTSALTRLTCVLDCCHSGTLMDLPYSFQCKGSKPQAGALDMSPKKANSGKKNIPAVGQQEQHKKEALPCVVMFSGCKDDQTSADVANTASLHQMAQGAGKIDPSGSTSSGGACSNALAAVLFSRFMKEMKEDKKTQEGEGKAPPSSSQVPQLTFAKLLREMRHFLKLQGFTQVPQLSSTVPVTMDSTFDLYSKW